MKNYIFLICSLSLGRLFVSQYESGRMDPNGRTDEEELGEVEGGNVVRIYYLRKNKFKMSINSEKDVKEAVCLAVSNILSRFKSSYKNN